MVQNNDYATLAAQLAEMSRDEITPQLLDFPSQTKLDFTEEYLQAQSTERLRHMLLAALLYLRPR